MKNKVVLYSIIAVLLIAGVAFSAYWAGRNTVEPEPTPMPTVDFEPITIPPIEPTATQGEVLQPTSQNEPSLSDVKNKLVGRWAAEMASYTLHANGVFEYKKTYYNDEELPIKGSHTISQESVGVYLINFTSDYAFGHILRYDYYADRLEIIVEDDAQVVSDRVLNRQHE